MKKSINFLQKSPSWMKSINFLQQQQQKNIFTDLKRLVYLIT